MKVKLHGIILAASLFSGANAYILVLLHNEAIGPHSFAFGAGHGQQVGGTGQIGGHAILWEGSSASAINLTPAGYTSSRAEAVSAGRQVGVGYNPGVDQFHALLWSGSASSFVSLHPSFGFRDTFAMGIGGDQQVGGGTDPMGENDKALLWRGTADSMVILHPAGFGISGAHATDGFQQVGQGSFSGSGSRALLWSGSAESMVDLTPTGAENAAAKGVAEDQQVGRVDGRAALWHGSASSFVSLSPGAEFGSDAKATNGTHQVGFRRGPGGVGGPLHAVRWSGSAESLLNLHDFLSPEWNAIESEAFGIDEAGNIVGYIWDGQANRAVMWVVPEPGTIAALAAGIGLLLARRRRT